MTLQHCYRNQSFEKGGKDSWSIEGQRENAAVQTQKINDEDKAARDEGKLFDAIIQIGKLLGHTGNVVPMMDRNGRLYSAGNIVGDGGMTRAIYEYDPVRALKFIEKGFGSDHIKGAADKLYHLIGSAPVENFEPLEPFYPRMDKNGIPRAIPHSAAFEKQRMHRGEVPDLNRVILSLSDITGSPNQKIRPFADGLHTLSPYFEVPNIMQTKRKDEEALDKKEYDESEFKPEVLEEAPVDKAAAALESANISGKSPDSEGIDMMAGVVYDPNRGEFVDRKTGEVSNVLKMFTRSRKVPEQQPESAITKSAGEMFTEMRAAREAAKKPVVDGNGSIDIVKTPTSALFKSRMRGSR